MDSELRVDSPEQLAQSMVLVLDETGTRVNDQRSVPTSLATQSSVHDERERREQERERLSRADSRRYHRGVDLARLREKRSQNRLPGPLLKCRNVRVAEPSAHDLECQLQQIGR